MLQLMLLWKLRNDLYTGNYNLFIFGDKISMGL
jgi:hypothetical protein